MLLGEEYFDNNLIFALAAYNAGPGTLRRWRRELAGVEDPFCSSKACLPVKPANMYKR